MKTGLLLCLCSYVLYLQGQLYYSNTQTPEPRAAAVVELDGLVQGVEDALDNLDAEFEADQAAIRFKIAELSNDELDEFVEAETSKPTWTKRQLLSAIAAVETGVTFGSDSNAVGDGGAALGPLQIHRGYHQDAQGVDIRVGPYRRMTEWSEAVRAFEAYMKRYAGAAYAAYRSNAMTLDGCEHIARIHNGGPKGYAKSATRRYWNRVKEHLLDT